MSLWLCIPLILLIATLRIQGRTPAILLLRQTFFGILDLSKLVPGSGENGRIEKSDVEAHLIRATASTALGSA